MHPVSDIQNLGGYICCLYVFNFSLCIKVKHKNYYSKHSSRAECIFLGSGAFGDLFGRNECCMGLMKMRE